MEILAQKAATLQHLGNLPNVLLKQRSLQLQHAANGCRRMMLTRWAREVVGFDVRRHIILSWWCHATRRDAMRHYAMWWAQHTRKKRAKLWQKGNVSGSTCLWRNRMKHKKNKRRGHAQPVAKPNKTRTRCDSRCLRHRARESRRIYYVELHLYAV